MPFTNPSSSHRSRRSFIASSLAAAAAGAAVARHSSAAPTQSASPAPLSANQPLPLYKAVKWGMLTGAPTPLEHFQVCKELGYDGIEMISPVDVTAADVRAASEKVGLPVHGVVDMKHWDMRLSSPDSKVRDEGVAFLEQAIRDCHAFGGFSVLLVPGRVNDTDETHDDVWKRSIVGIRKALPLASRLGVRILIENVWNGFCETPEQYRDYLDEIDSPWVGAYFDIGNVIRFSPSENWIRVLGPRIVKLDVKDWDTKQGFDAKIGEGGVNWPAVRQALHEIRFSGWCTAEVAVGDRAWLADIASRMDKFLIK